MARRRLNTKFLLLIGIPVVVLVGLGIAYKTIPQLKWIVRGTPAYHAQLGKQLFDEGKYKEAGEKYKRAIQLKGSSDAEMYTALGNCYLHLVADDTTGETLRDAMTFFTQALTADPNYMPALSQMLRQQLDEAEMMRRGASAIRSWQSIGETADKILRIDPKDHQAQVARNRAVIEQWTGGVETDLTKVDAAIASLTALGEQAPFDGKTFALGLTAQLLRAQGGLRVNDRAGATEAIANIRAAVKRVLEEFPDEPSAHFRASQLLYTVGAVEHPESRPFDIADSAFPEATRAKELVKPDHPDYGEIYAFYGRLCENRTRPRDAEAAYREWMKQLPEDPVARLTLATLLSRNPATQDESLDLLANMPKADPKKYSGVRAMMFRNYDLAALAQTLNVQLEKLEGIRETAARTEYIAKIQEGYDKLVSNPGLSESPDAMQIKGRLELAKNDAIAAVQTLERARKDMRSESDPTGEVRYKTLLSLARAYLLTQQSGQAKLLFQQVINDFSPQSSMPARLQLVQLLMAEGDLEGAKKHVDIIAKAMPNAPIVARLRILSLDKVKDKAKLNELYGQLPEGDRGEKLSKAQMAIYADRKDDAIRLYNAVYKETPDDLQLMASLARLYADTGNKTDAVALVQDAIKRKPEVPALKLLLGEVSGEDTGEVKREFVEQMTDPLKKELALYNLSLQEDKPDEAETHLQAAAKLAPDDPGVNSLLFRRAMQQRQWDKAAPLLEKLAKMNQDQADGQLLRVQFAMAQGDLNTANDLATQVTQKLPEFAQSWVVLGQVQQAQQKYSEAMANFNSALSKQSQNLDAFQGLIACAYQLKQYDAAKGYIDQARRIFPSNPALHEMAIQHEMLYGDPTVAIPQRQELLDKAPDHPENWFNLARTFLFAAKSKGYATADGKAYLAKSRDTLSKAIEKWPDNFSMTSALVEVSAVSHDLSTGEHAIAALRAQPNWKDKVELALLASDFYSRMGDAGSQQKVLREYLDAHPGEARAQIQLARAYGMAGKFDDGLKVLPADSSDPEVRRMRIEMQINAGRLADAEKEVDAAIAASPQPPPDLLVSRGYILMNSSRVTQALEIFDKVLKDSPNLPDALFYRASIYVAAQRKLEDAIRDLRIVRDTSSKPDDRLRSRLLLAQAMRMRGNDDDAISELEAGVKDTPTDRALRLRLVESYMSTQPPRWGQAERAFKEARDIPELSKDPDLTNLEAQMWDSRKDADKAIDLAQQALRASPGNAQYLHTLLNAMYDGKKYSPIIAMTDPMVRDKKTSPPWWVYQYRGKARKGLDDKQGAIEELSAGIDAASASKDDAAAATLVQTMADEIGVGPAKARVIARAEKGENRWRLLMARLLQIENDHAGAVEWGEKVVNDSAATPFEQGVALNFVGPEYLKLDPPNIDKAIASFQKLLEKDPNDVASLNNLACTIILPKSGRTPAEAMKYSKQAMDIVESAGLSALKPYIYDTHGYVLILSGQIDEGVNLLQQSIDRQAIPDAYYHLGEAYLKMPTPKPVEAAEAFKQAMALLEQAAKTGGEKSIDTALKARVEDGLQRAQQASSSAKS